MVVCSSVVEKGIYISILEWRVVEGFRCGSRRTMNGVSLMISTSLMISATIDEWLACIYGVSLMIGLKWWVDE